MNYAIVVPCYNEEAVLNETTGRLLEVMQRVAEKHADLQGRIVYVDDGSSDGTWSLIGSLSKQHPQVMGLKLAHNAGHQHALWAGLEWAAAHVDAAISIDADLQDDVNVIPEMIDLFLGGKDIVYGVRRDRPTDTWFKRTTALAFYKLMSKLGGDIVYNHADYRLMSRRTLAALMTYGERNLFLRGIVRTLGFPQAMVYYDRGERFAGESKYPLRKMLAFAIDGITSFSVRPLRLISIVGLSFMLVALAVIVYGLVAWLCGRTIQGWTSLLVSLWFIGGAILVALGVIGEYVGKIYAEVKRRPRYFIEETTE